MKDATIPGLEELAVAAGILVYWRDVSGLEHKVVPSVLCRVLDALQIEAGTPRQIADSLARLREQDKAAEPVLLTASLNQPIALPSKLGEKSRSFQIDLEQGEVLHGHLVQDQAGKHIIPGLDVPGYHTCRIGSRKYVLAVAPARCYSMQDALGHAGAREWALAVQVYSLRRKVNAVSRGGADAGFGDFAALEALALTMASRGAAALAISPVHAMFSADARRYSPYAPSSRLFLNVLYIDPAEVFGQAAVAHATAVLGLSGVLNRLDAMALIDWPEAAAVKLAILRFLYEGFPENAGQSMQDDLLVFRGESGKALEEHACFEALHARQMAQGLGHSEWRDWPAALQSPHSQAVASFAKRHAREVDFHIFLQWLANRGLARVQSQARGAGMPIGLISDLAVGADPAGSHAWSRQGEVLAGLSPGAPPDLYNPFGQSWGLTAFSPHSLASNGYRAFIEMLRASLKHAGGVRIDHALGLSRMWLVPEGSSPTAGAYVRYPLRDMMRLLALESWRHRAIVIGENLGTVPEGFNQSIEEAGMLGMEVLWFAREGAGPDACFRPPRRWPAQAIAMTSTHDLPTVAGWWSGTDLGWRERLGLLGPDTSIQMQTEERARDRECLWHDLSEAGVAPGGMAPPVDQAPVASALGFVAATPAPLVVLPLEDLLGRKEQPNLPGTTDEHPNWRRRIDVPAEELLGAPGVERCLASLAKHRRVI